MNILVIGGTLYFGKVIVQKLLARGDSVTIYSRGQTRPDFWDDVAHIQGDRNDYEDFVEKLKGKSFDAVIDNLAFKWEDAQAVVKALKGQTGKYLVASTVSIYGGPGHALKTRRMDQADTGGSAYGFVDLNACSPLREEDVDLTTVGWEYDPEIEVYAQGKRHVERYLDETPDFPWVVMRVPATMGPEDPTLRFWWYLQRILDEREIILLDGGSNVFRLGFRDDVADAFIDAMDSPNTSNHIYNICQDEIPTLRRFLEGIAHEAGRDLNAVSVPGEAAEALSDLPWDEWRFSPFARPSTYVMSIAKARRDFGHRCTPMDEWIRETVSWYAESYDGPDSALYDRRDEEVEFARWWRGQYAQFMEGAMKSRKGK